jgi:hypothetical protein
MLWLIKKLAVKAAEKAAKIDMTDVFTQTNADDIVLLFKDVVKDVLL